METARDPMHTTGHSGHEFRLPAAAPSEIKVPTESGGKGGLTIVCSTCEVSWIETEAPSDNRGPKKCWSCGNQGGSPGKLSSIVSPYR